MGKGKWCVWATAILFCAVAVCPGIAMSWQADGQNVEIITFTLSPSFGVAQEMAEQTVIIRPLPGAVVVPAVGLYRAEDGAIDGLLQCLEENGFWSMPEHLDTGVLDGDFAWLTVTKTNGQTKKVGGLAAHTQGPDAFVAIYRALQGVMAGGQAYPSFVVGEQPPADTLQGGQPLFTYCDAQAVAERLHSELPARVSVWYETVAGGTPYTTTDGATIEKIVEALQGITVYETQGWGHTDDYLNYRLEWADADAFQITFQTGMLMGNRGELCPVTGFDALLMALPPIVL